MRAVIASAQWDQCGEMLTTAGMGGMDEMGQFYDHCLEALYPPGSCAFLPHTIAPSHTLSCLISSISTCLNEISSKRSGGPFPPGGYLCNAHTFECYLAEVQESCCDEGGLNCPEGECVQHRRWIQFHKLKRQANPSSGATTQAKMSRKRVQ